MNDIEGIISLNVADLDNYFATFLPLQESSDYLRKSAIIVCVDGLLSPSLINVLVTLKGRYYFKDGVVIYIVVTGILRSNLCECSDPDSLSFDRTKVENTKIIVGVVTHISSIFILHGNATGV